MKIKDQMVFHVTLRKKIEKILQVDLRLKSSVATVIPIRITKRSNNNDKVNKTWVTGIDEYLPEKINLIGIIKLKNWVRHI
jgi:hypothetical protein